MDKQWTDEELIGGLIETNAWNDYLEEKVNKCPKWKWCKERYTPKLNTSWLVNQLQLRSIGERIEQAGIDGYTIAFDNGQLVVLDREET